MTTVLRAESPGRHRARWVLPALGALAAVILVVVVLTALGLGPFATGPDVPGADFSAERYPGDPDPLRVSDVATRTTAPDADAEAPAAIADGDPSTAWRSSGQVPAGSEVLDTIDLFLGGPVWIERLELHNGDHVDRDAYDASASLREARLRFDGGVELLVELLDVGLGAQEIVLPGPVLTSNVRIDVLDRVPGPSDQLAVSEITVIGWPAEGDDVELARRRASVEPATGPETPVGPG
ncbi:MAG: hypothetical protein WEB09_10280 [Nitriliruptor sp.]